MKRLCFVCFLFALVTSVFGEVSINGPLTLEQTAKPGENYKGDIVLLNNDETPQEAKVYLTDYFFSADDKVFYEDPGTRPRSNSAWLTYTPKRLTIPPKGSASISYSVKVPDSKDLLGTYWCVMMVEGIASESAESSKAPKTPTVSVSQVIRYALQVITHIGDSGKRNLKFTNSKLALDKDKKTLLIDVENTGDYMLRAYISVELYDQKGTLAGKYTGDAFRLFPGTSKKFKTDLSAAPKGKYKAIVIADCGSSNVYGVNISLTL
jgi:hypothetical protein